MLTTQIYQVMGLLLCLGAFFTLLFGIGLVVYLAQRRKVHRLAHRIVSGLGVELRPLRKTLRLESWYVGEREGKTFAVAFAKVKRGGGTYSRHQTGSALRVFVGLSRRLNYQAYRRSNQGDAFEERFAGTNLQAIAGPLRDRMMTFNARHGYLFVGGNGGRARVRLHVDAFKDAPSFVMHSTTTGLSFLKPVSAPQTLDTDEFNAMLDDLFALADHIKTR